MQFTLDFFKLRKVDDMIAAEFVCDRRRFGRYGLLCGRNRFFPSWKKYVPIRMWPSLSVSDFDLADMVYYVDEMGIF